MNGNTSHRKHHMQIGMHRNFENCIVLFSYSYKQMPQDRLFNVWLAYFNSAICFSFAFWEVICFFFRKPHKIIRSFYTRKTLNFLQLAQMNWFEITEWHLHVFFFSLAHLTEHFMHVYKWIKCNKCLQFNFVTWAHLISFWDGIFNWNREKTQVALHNSKCHWNFIITLAEWWKHKL